MVLGGVVKPVAGKDDSEEERTERLREAIETRELIEILTQFGPWVRGGRSGEEGLRVCLDSIDIMLLF